MGKRQKAPLALRPQTQTAGSGRSAARQRAMVDFVTDPEGRDLKQIWEECGYRELGVTLTAFRRWSQTGGWVRRRETWARDIEERVLQRVADQAIADRWGEYQRVRDLLPYLTEYLEPLRDELGRVRRYPFKDEAGMPHPAGGLPMFPLPLGKLSEHVETVTKLLKKSATLRGDVTKRTEHITHAITTVEGSEPGTVGAKVSRADLHELGQQLIKDRDPRFAEVVIDIRDNDDGHD